MNRSLTNGGAAPARVRRGSAFAQQGHVEWSRTKASGLCRKTSDAPAGAESGRARVALWRIENAVASHIPAIAAGMREADAREVWASDRWVPCEALEKSLLASVQAWTCLVDGAPAFMWGVSRRGSVFSDTGIPWLLATDAIYKVSHEFLKQSRAYVERMHEHFPCLENRVHAENSFSMRWLKWCGFTIEENPDVMNGEKFYLFWRVRNA